MLRGHVDQPVAGAMVYRRRLTMRGWHVWGNDPVIAIAVEVEVAGETILVLGRSESRPDVAAALGDPRLDACGWVADVELSDGAGRGASGGGSGGSDEGAIRVTVWGAPDASPVALPPILVRLSDAPVAVGARLLGRLDAPDEGVTLDRTLVRIAGWAFTEVAPVTRVEVLVNDTSAGFARLGLPRVDVASDFSEPHAEISGFEHYVDLSAWPALGREARIAVRAWVARSGPLHLDSRRYTMGDTGGGTTEGGTTERQALLVARREKLIAISGRIDPAHGPLDLVVFTHDLNRGGAQLWLTEFLRRAGAGGRFACRVVTPHDGPLREVLENDGIEVHVSQDYPVADLDSYEGRVTELAVWLAAEGHNAALVNTFRPWIGVDAARRVGLPVVWAIHESWNPAALWPAFFEPGSVPAAVQATFMRTLGDAQALVFVAEATRRLYQAAAADPNRTVVVPYGVDVASIETYCEQVSRVEAREQTGLPADGRVLLVLGTVEPRKSQTLLAAAFAEVAPQFPDAHLAVVGDISTPYARALGRYLDRRGLGPQARLVPVVADTRPWYRAADALVCGSDIESLPRTILEAMAFSLPVLATSVFGVPEVLTDGVTGYLFPTGDLEAATGALRRLLSAAPADLDAVAAAGHRLAVDHYDSSGYGADILTLLEGFRADPSHTPAEILARRPRFSGPGRP